ncbi:Marine sediment metagenome DNA, contig: S03H2_S09216 OS=marine sediment metagenome GN=S03H2_41307 PE=4 SV=1 [Gemmata massiliana]|uniref:Marine sediment metagenome DNA, contig: S03H2_S09216 n=1 Tax=Gemmata massiliana TaxID=1210884 RepID=A0A6P2D2Z1_9BACT|nr:Marine sediment metagenome DNA, contig: S03H2_S09216 OS=marine sediment metagenome GN=S03H2_41307 PE=4 SV=1 [Gemmata massiliana]
MGQAALRLTQGALPLYSAVTSRKEFTLHQLFAVLALRTFLRTDYRGVAFLKDFTELRDDLGLKKVSCYSTVCYAEDRLLKGRPLALLRYIWSGCDRRERQ